MALRFRSSLLTIAAVTCASCAPSAQAQRPVAPSPVQFAPPAATYADLADLALQAPVAAHVQLRRAIPVRPENALGVAPGFSRFYVEADILALIRGEPGMPSQVQYLVDLPNDARGRPARPEKRAQWLIFARPVRGAPGELQLVTAQAQIPFSPILADQTRAILREGLTADAPPALTGIGRAFHTPGTLPGTSETQFFLQTADNRPISITVSREPNRPPRWFVSLSEFVEAGATQPQRDTLLWFRLACALPAALPPASFADSREHAQAIQADYQVVRQSLGTCERLRTRG